VSVPGDRPWQRLSVVITNYNYEDYVAEAIESALAVRWDDLEVVIVDDGSTDGSREVIDRYRSRVEVLLTENGGQRVAANRGYARCTGDVVVFLDSDDVLPPELAERLAEVWSPEVSKVQFRMQRIDAEGKPIGSPFPAFRPVPTPADVRRWMTATSAYPTPPGSGNAYARWFLDRVFPLDERLGDASDSACLAAAPLLGDVVTLPEVVVGYRRHGANDSNLLGDTRRFPREVRRARARWRYAQQLRDEPTNEVGDGPLFRSRELLQLRVASWRLVPDERPLPGDSRWRVLLDSLRAPLPVGPEPAAARVLIMLWCLATLLAPGKVARALVRRRYGGAW